MSDRKKRQQGYILCIMGLSGLSSLVLLIPLFSPFYSVFCRNEFVGYSDADGVSMCVVQGALLLYCILGSCTAMVLQSHQLYSKIVCGNMALGHNRLMISLIFIVPLVLVGINSVFGSFGYGFDYPWCFTVNTTEQYFVQVFIYYGPVVLSLFCVILFMGPVIFTILKTVSTEWNYSRSIVVVGHGRGLTLKQTFLAAQYRVARYLISLAVARTSILFTVLFLFVWLSVFVTMAKYYVQEKEIKKSYDVWLHCIFTYFSDEEPALWIGECGEHPKLRYDALVIVWAFSIQSILAALVFLPYSKVVKYFQSTGNYLAVRLMVSYALIRRFTCPLKTSSILSSSSCEDGIGLGEDRIPLQRHNSTSGLTVTVARKKPTSMMAPYPHTVATPARSGKVVNSLIRDFSSVHESGLSGDRKSISHPPNSEFSI